MERGSGLAKTATRGASLHPALTIARTTSAGEHVPRRSGIAGVRGCLNRMLIQALDRALLGKRPARWLPCHASARVGHMHSAFNGFQPEGRSAPELRRKDSLLFMSSERPTSAGQCSESGGPSRLLLAGRSPIKQDVLARAPPECTFGTARLATGVTACSSEADGRRTAAVLIDGAWRSVDRWSEKLICRCNRQDCEQDDKHSLVDHETSFVR
jgi:hypothetical protein